MLRIALITFWLLCFYGSLRAQQAGAEEASIRETVLHYIEGRNKGDSVRLQKAFHADAVLKSVNPQGELTVWTARDYIRRMSTGRKQNCTGEILEVRAFHNAAQATVVLKYPSFTYYDYLNLLKVGDRWLITDKIFAGRPVPKKILMVVSSDAVKDLTGRHSGVDLKGVSAVYKALSEAGYAIDFVSPEGGVRNLYGYEASDPAMDWFLDQEAAMAQLLKARRPEEVQAESYQAICFAGGAGALSDLPGCEKICTLAGKIWAADGLVAAIGEGTAGLLNLKTAEGEFLVKGRRVTGFAGREAVCKLPQLPLQPEAELKQRGALFTATDGSPIITDGRLITGRDAACAALFAATFLNELNKINK